MATEARFAERLQQLRVGIERWRLTRRQHGPMCHHRAPGPPGSPESPGPRDHPDDFEAVLRPSRQRMMARRADPLVGHGGFRDRASPAEG
jgi:hypothetical protein